MFGGVLEGITLTSAVSIVTVLGPFGLVLIMWHADHRRYEREVKEHRKEMADVLARYEKDVSRIARFYEDNVYLVKSYQRLSGDLANIIHLNTQVQTNLVNKIENNMFCPAIREKGAGI